MYELLLDADLVIADLSTSNANALYELGVRHALRPSTTIVIAEKQFKFPFDISHLLVRPYVRSRVIPLCQAWLDAGVKDDEGQPDSAERFWVQASVLEAYVGSGRQQEAQALEAQIRATAPEGWMIESMDSQIKQLKALIGNG